MTPAELEWMRGARRLLGRPLARLAEEPSYGTGEAFMTSHVEPIRWLRALDAVRVRTLEGLLLAAALPTAASGCTEDDVSGMDASTGIRVGLDGGSPEAD